MRSKISHQSENPLQFLFYFNIVFPVLPLHSAGYIAEFPKKLSHFGLKDNLYWLSPFSFNFNKCD